MRDCNYKIYTISVLHNNQCSCKYSVVDGTQYANMIKLSSVILPCVVVIGDSYTAITGKMIHLTGR